MTPTVKAGIVLGVLVVAWTFVMGFTGWYKDPALLSLFYVVILIEIGVLIWGLKMTAEEGNTYGKQIGAGTLMAVIGAVIIFIGSYIFTSAVYPNYFEEIREVGRQQLLATGMSASDVEAQLNLQAPMQTSFVSALTGAVMTVVTGVIASLVIAIFVRRKPAAAPVQA